SRLLLLTPRRPPFFPYTTLFRSMRAEILSYSRARGVFAGISLDGSTLRPDERANHKLYGNSASAAKIITKSHIKAPSSAHDMGRSEEHTSELQSHLNLVCRLLLE